MRRHQGCERLTITMSRSSNEVLISLPEQPTRTALDAGRQQILDALRAHYSNPITVQQGAGRGPTVGKQLEKQAALATLYSLLGMLIYLWFRFQLIYGVAAVVACFHDTLITVGAFALTGQEISLTVIAAILTLVGYSMNDTIVVFDRIRENLRLSRRESLPDVVNRSINQTLSRTVLTSGLTFLTVLSLYIFGGQVLKGFSFALVVGILDRHIFVDCSRRADAGGMAGMAREAGERLWFCRRRRREAKIRFHERANLSAALALEQHGFDWSRFCTVLQLVLV